MSYAKGYRKDLPHKRTQKISRELLGAIPEPPAESSAEEFEGSTLDQNSCGSCTGHGTSQGLTVAFAKSGKPLTFRPSPKDIYALTRAEERPPNTDATLQDTGGMPADVMLAISQWGVRAMQAPSPLGFNTDVDSSNVADQPVFADLQADAQKLVTGEYRIDEAATDFITQVKAGVYQCGAVGIGVFVDTAFEQWGEGWDASRAPIDSVDLQDPNGGGHWIVITSYRTQPDGTVVFRGPNSWTDQWGDKGHFEVTANWLQAACSDCYVFNIGGS